jgi:MFS family permease
MRDAMLKPTILSVSLLTIMASAAVSPALAQIRAAFPGVSPTTVKLILTLPSLMIIPFSLLSGWLSARVPKRSILLVGLLIYAAGGVGGAAARSIRELLALRCVLGVGIGLIMPLSTTLIADFFSGPARTRMMGLSGAVTNVGGVIFLSAAGWLACTSWRLAFSVYALALVTMFMVAFWLPEPPRAPRAARTSKVGLPAAVFACTALGLLMMAAFYAVPTNLALFESREDLERHLSEGSVSPILRERFAAQGIVLSEGASLQEEERGRRWIVRDGRREYPVIKEGSQLSIRAERLGRPALAGTALSAMTLSGALAGAILGLLVRWLGAFAVPVAIGLMGIGFGLLAQATSMLMIFAAVPFIGFSAGVLMPSLLLRVPKVAPPESRALAMAVVSGGVFFGQFISPLLLRWIALLLGRDTFRSRFGFLAAGLAAAALLALVTAIRARVIAGRAQAAAPERSRSA